MPIMFPTRAIEIDKIDYTMCLTIVIQETVSHNGEGATDGSVINVPPWPSASGLKLAADKPLTAARPVKRSRPERGRNLKRNNLRQTNYTILCGEIKLLFDGFCGERFPAIDFAHVGLAGSK
jgi:hypothetical protein